MAVEHLPGKLVVEVGERQAWPFLTFLDTGSGPERELRLYLDTDWLITTPGDVRPAPAGAPDNPLPELARINNRYVVTAVENADESLDVTFDNDLTLRVSGEPTETTIGVPWWLSPWSREPQEEQGNQHDQPHQ
ncbi:hypothetical protein [Streptomyces sp. NPDC094049]|uniref:hypothetical protein n=1 Tax=Streptomyces sp. NPDC094049 TaxID=3154987 RepID=UPI003323517F